MEFLGVGPMELAFIILIALILIGPRDLAKTARSAGRFLNRMYHSEAWKTLNEASQNLRTLPNRLAREAELEDLKEIKQTLNDARAAINQPAGSASQAMQAWSKTSADAKENPPPESPPSAPSGSAAPIAEGMRAWTEPASPSSSNPSRQDAPQRRDGG